jgi:uncharacterized protein
VEQARILQHILQQFALPVDGLHGPHHWARVLMFARRLSLDRPVRAGVVERFAMLHDACRVSDGPDAGHGQRAAALARRLQGRLYRLDDADAALLERALGGHAGTAPDPGDETIRICWDAERLDLGRLGITPRLGCLYSRQARDPELIAWASALSLAGHVPELLATEWGGLPRSRRAAH